MRYAWSTMRNLFDDQEFLVPAQLVGLPTGESTVPFMGPWAATSNGLASGNNFAEAVCAALYEVIERDATTCWQIAHARGFQPLTVDPGVVSGAVLGELLDVLTHAGVDPLISWCPTDVGVPTFLAYVVDRERNVGVYKGYGCHLDPEIAMIRAVTEAVQSRTIFVAGARDDLTRAAYAALKRSDVVDVSSLRVPGDAVSIADIPNRATGSFHGDVAVLLDRLRAAGFEHALARRFDATEFEVDVARVIVPGLEPYRFQWLATGERAAGFDPTTVGPK
jgi:YcaO-like protein with predicted kinase domain